VRTMPWSAACHQCLPASGVTSTTEIPGPQAYQTCGPLMPASVTSTAACAAGMWRTGLAVRQVLPPSAVEMGYVAPKSWGGAPRAKPLRGLAKMRAPANRLPTRVPIRRELGPSGRSRWARTVFCGSGPLGDEDVARVVAGVVDPPQAVIANTQSTATGAAATADGRRIFDVAGECCHPPRGVQARDARLGQCSGMFPEWGLGLVT
jgi:hypothetical protein